MFTRLNLYSEVFVLMVFCCIHGSIAAGPATQPTDAVWGDAVDGLGGKLEIQGRPTLDYHPGELLTCFGSVQNVTKGWVSFVASGADYTAIHLRIPDGRELIWKAGQKSDKTSWEKSPQQLDRGSSVLVCNAPIRLEERPTGWVEAGSQQSCEVSFRSSGKYELWFECSVHNRNPRIWSGTLTSNHVTITVSELPPGKRLQEPTPEQLKALERYLGPDDERTPHDGHDELEKAIGKTENEGLAMQMLKLALTDRANRAGLLFILEERFAGIDGPYLQRFAAQFMPMLEHPEPNQVEVVPEQANDTLLSGIISYLHFHPDDAEMKRRLIELAKQSGNVSLFDPRKAAWEHLEMCQAVRPGGALFIGFSRAWEILIDMKVLRDGLTMNETAAILGPPQRQTADSAAWFYASEMHVIPSLEAVVEKGKLSQFRIGRY